MTLSVRVWSLGARAWSWSVTDEHGNVRARGRCHTWLKAYQVAHGARVRLHMGQA